MRQQPLTKRAPRPRSREIVDWPELSSSSIDSSTKSKRNSSHDDDLSKKRRNAKRYVVEVREPALRDIREHRLSGYYREGSLVQRKTWDDEREEDENVKKQANEDRIIINDEEALGMIPWDTDSNNDFGADFHETALHNAHSSSLNSRNDDDTAEASSDEESIFSIRSLVTSATDLSKGSKFSAVQIATATRELITILQDDEALQPLYTTAIYGTIGPRKFAKQFRRLLRKCSDNLKDEAQDSIDYLAAQLVARKARHVAEAILERYQAGLAPELDPQPNLKHDSSSEEDENQVTGVDDSVFEKLTGMKEFLVGSLAFKELRTSLEHFISPPKAFSKETGEQKEQVESKVPKAAAFHTAINNPISTAIQRAQFTEKFSEYSMQHLFFHKLGLVDAEDFNAAVREDEDVIYSGLIQLFGEDITIFKLHICALNMAGKVRFVTEYTEILRSFYTSLCNEIGSNLEYHIASHVRTTLDWPHLAYRIVSYLEMTNMGSLDEGKPCLPIDGDASTAIPITFAGTDRTSSGYASESKDQHFRKMAAISKLKTDLRLLSLRQSIREVTLSSPRSLIRISSENNPSFINRIKAGIEDFTRSEWDWWPLGPRIPDVSSGQFRLEWMVRMSSN